MKKKTISLNNKEVDIYIDEDSTLYLSAKSLSIIYSKDISTMRKYLTKNKQNAPEMHSKCTRDALIKGSRKIAVYNVEILSLLDGCLNQDNASLLSNYLSSNNSKENEQTSDIIDDFDNKVITFDNGIISIDVNVSPKEETVWLDENQISTLFETTRQNINLHIKNIFEESELDMSICKKNLRMLSNGRNYNKTFYNLDAILSIGYRVKSKRAIEFRKWVSSIMKNYLIKGYAINNNRIIKANNIKELENELSVLTKQMFTGFSSFEQRIDLIDNEIQKLKEELIENPVKEKLFYDGKYFDAHEFIIEVLLKAKENIILIDPYFDTSGLSLLTKVDTSIPITICKASFGKLDKDDLESFKKQYGRNILIKNYDFFHDRFIILDNSICYSIGASLNRMGSKIFLTYLVDSEEIINNLIDTVNNIEEEM